MVLLTLRLPEDLHRRLRLASERTGTSMNSLIVSTLDEAVPMGKGAVRPNDSLREQVQQVRRALGDLAVDVDVNRFPPHLWPAADLPDTDTHRHSMPCLVPPLSATIIAVRDDRV